MPFKPQKGDGTPTGIDKLRTILNQTKLATENNALYQFCNSLLHTMDKNITGLQTTITEVKTAFGGGAAVGAIIASPTVESKHYDAPLSDGDLIAADLIYAAGECIIVQVPIP